MKKFEKLCLYIDIVVANLIESEERSKAHKLDYCASMYHDMRTGCEMIKKYKEALCVGEEDLDDDAVDELDATV